MSESPDKPSPTEINQAIEAHGATLKKPPEGEALDGLKDRLDRVELLIEEIGQQSEVIEEIGRYVADLRSELVSIKTIRTGAILLSVIMASIWTGATLGIARSVIVFGNNLNGQYVLPAIIFSSIAIGALIISLVLRGVFRMTSERHKDDVLPPHVKELVEAYKLFRGV